MTDRTIPIAVALGVVLLGSPGLTAEESTDLDSLMQLAGGGSWDLPSDTEEAEFHTFHTGLASLGMELDAGAWQAPVPPIYGIRDAFASIAVDRARKPERFDELFDYYGRWHGDPAIQPAAFLPATLNPDHVTEAYRLAWESLLLSPVSREIRFMGKTITRALGRIGDERSIPVLVFAYNRVSSEEVTQRGPAIDRQVQVLKGLGQFATQEALEAILSCLDRSETRAAGKPLPKVSGYNVRQWAFRIFSDRDNYGTRQKWREVINNSRGVGFSTNYQELLDQVLEDVAIGPDATQTE